MVHSTVAPSTHRLLPLTKYSDTADTSSCQTSAPQDSANSSAQKFSSSGHGGLGSPVSLYLALAGVGTIGVVDFDVVDVSNLQRQILHTDADVGRRKVISAKETLEAHNPDVNVIVHEEPINASNAMDIIPNDDIVVNGADNFATRYLVNDAAYLAGKPLVDGAILVFDGQAATYIPRTRLLPMPIPRPAAAGRSA